ncbi:FitA-like ribbon-helix-helix domain-containing protein [Nostoc sp.]|uniref:FitA-like ribbon-helix-helix domain-containing protein n=1 Tax=Nostoc sp. TaxID=1180 RepID=UPI002FFB5814
MNNISISNLDDDIKSRLKKRAEKHGCSLEEEAREIIRMALIENHEQPLNLATLIEKRFVNLGDFELPEIPREPIRTVSTFEELLFLIQMCCQN